MSFQGLAVGRGDVNTLQVHMDISMFSIVFSLVLYFSVPVIVCLLYLYLLSLSEQTFSSCSVALR